MRYFIFHELKITRDSPFGEMLALGCCCASLVDKGWGREQGFVRARTMAKCSHRYLQPMASGSVTGNIMAI